jgi:hypothetical protein
MSTPEAGVQQLVLPLDEDLGWDAWFRALPRSPVVTLSNRRPSAPLRAVVSPRKARGSTHSSAKMGVGSQPTTEEE